ncbi:MAG: cadherin domain-containing protein [Chitinophagaceae bacterium]
MKKNLLLLTFLSLLGSTHLRAGDPPASLSGTYLVGSSQPVYKKLTDIVNALSDPANTVTGNLVFELDSDYNGTSGESFPLLFSSFNSSGNWTVTIRPKAGVSLRTTSGDPGGGLPLIILDGTDNLILDGRPGGSGTSIGWLIRNANTAADAESTVWLMNDAKNNTLTWLQLEGQTTVSGIISVRETIFSDGNDNNKISYCMIRDRTDQVGRPAKGIVFSGMQTELSGFHSGNTITHNDLVNIYNASGAAYGIDLASAVTATTITYNNFYQTAAIEANSTTSSVCAIYVRAPAASDMEISYNFAGGSAPGCGGQPYTLTATGTNCIRFAGIVWEASGSTATGNKVRYNTIRNLAIAAGKVPDYNYTIFAGIRVNGTRGAEVTGNIIGHNQGHDDIVLSTTGSQGLAVYGIYYGYQSGGSVAGNKIGGITIGGTANSGLSFLNAIYLNKISANEPADFNVTGNLIGSSTTTDNIRATAPDIPMYFYGIYSNLTSPVTQNIKNDTIAGISMAYNGTAPVILVTAISMSGNAISVVDHNLISDMSSASRAASDYYTFLAINCSGLTSPVISNNTVRHMYLTGTSPMGLSQFATTSYVLGVQVTGSGRARVYNNRFYDFTTANEFPSAPATLCALDIKMNAVVYNNVISLANGNHTNNCEIRAIRVLSPPDSARIYHNSIYLGGTNGGSANSYAIGRQGGTNVMDIRNNLLVNARAGSGSHYIFMNRTAADWPVSSSDNNVLISATPAKTALWGTGTVLDTTQWKTTGGDVHSSFYTVADLTPANLFVDFDSLKIKEEARDYVTGKGAAGTGIANDILGILRNPATPAAGAYEYGMGGNIAAPVITSHGGASSVTVPVIENTTMVTTVTATDTDPGTEITYRLAEEGDIALFTINATTGALSFIAAPDYEQPTDGNADNVYIVTVEAFDGAYTATQRFKVKVTDGNDHAPVITSYNGDLSVSLRVEENTTAAAGTVTATDADKTAIITYSLEGEDAAKFTMNPSTGVLKFTTLPDFDQPGDTDGDNIYMLTVKASDGDSFVTQRFKIKVTDLNDNTPVFSSHDGDALVNVELPEHTQAVTTVAATDNDGAAVVYAILNEDDGALFTINAAGMLSFVTAPDFEHPADANSDNLYKVSVSASDGSLSAVQQFLVRVTDLDDHAPTVTMTIRVPENTVDITPLEGMDEDAGSSPVLFTLLSTEDGALFRLNPASGSLEFRNVPDFEQPADADHDNIYLVSVKMEAGDIITVLRFRINVGDADEGAGRMASRSIGQPEQPQATAKAEFQPVSGKRIKAWPNPVTGKRFTLQIDSVAAGRYQLEIYATSGQLAWRQPVTHAGQPAAYPIQLPAQFTPGVYFLKLTGAGIIFMEKLIIQ